MAMTTGSASNIFAQMIAQRDEHQLRALYDGMQNQNPYMQSGSGAASAPIANPEPKEAQPNHVLLLLEDL